MTSYDWIIGLGLMFGLALVFNSLIFENLEGFIIFLTLFCAFVVYADLLPLWVLVFNIIILTITIYYEINKKGAGV